MHPTKSASASPVRNAEPQPGQVYDWHDARSPASHAYLLPRLEALVPASRAPYRAKALDFGCGNGSLAGWLADKGFDPIGVDLSPTGVAIARRTYPLLPFSNDLSADNIAALGPFELALCIEVIAHCFDPVGELRKIFSSLTAGGKLILATPYYGYFKDVALALSGRLDRHWSIPSVGSYANRFTIPMIDDVLRGIGFVNIRISRIGRIPLLARDMIVVAERPLAR